MSIVLAIPSKGRLQEQSLAFFSRAGLNITQSGGARNYRGFIAGVKGIEIAFLSASEISRELAQGHIHMGITGEDLVRETTIDNHHHIISLTSLGFGHANVVVAVPKAWIDVANMSDLDDIAAGYRARHGRKLRLATKYSNLTRMFFTDHGIADYRIVESLGATEGAPAAGSADLIVDITSTGATLSANHLKILQDGVILRSEANLFASLKADWDDSARNLAATMLTRIAAQAAAQDIREIKATVADQARQGREAIDRFQCRLPFGAVGGVGLLILHCPTDRVWDCTAWLRNVGAKTVTIHHLDYVYEEHNMLVENLFSHLDEKNTKNPI